ncbi:Peptidoglycan-recognition protein SB1 [Lamellibrachia satsuma]|nr:Peptidoglycan-recognition protein SB1 [Lamellibrachia satsuma]
MVSTLVYSILNETNPAMTTREASTRYGRACRLVVEEGTRSVREFVLANLNPRRRDGLSATLKPLCELFLKLKAKSTISDEQFAVLYPSHGDPINEDDIDLTLWVLLMRNATFVSDKAINKKSSTVTDADKTCRAAVLCIKEGRNTLFHKSRHELDEDEFDQLWWEVSNAITRLRRSVSGDYQEEREQVRETLERLKTADLDQQSTERSIFKVQMQSLGEMRGIAVKDATRKRWTYGVLAMQILLTVAIIAGLAIAMWKYFEANQKCTKSIQYISTNGGLINFEPRSGWGARSASDPLKRLKTPVKYVIVSHTAVLARCQTTEKCCEDTDKVQYFNMHVSGFSDIAYNYLIGGSGVVLEGRGPDVWSAAARGWNNVSLTFAFMGLYERTLPSEEALRALQNFLGYLVTEGKLQNDYIIYGLCQVRPFSFSPGERVYREIQTWPHWRNNSGDSNCKRGGYQHYPVYRHEPSVRVLDRQ